MDLRRVTAVRGHALDAWRADHRRLRAGTLRLLLPLVRLSLRGRGHGGPARFRFLGYSVRGLSPETVALLYREVVLRGEYDPGVELRAPVIVDAGANVGFSVLYFKWLYPDARIHAFEPAPDAFELLRENVEANGLEGVHLHRCALGSEAGTARFYRGVRGGLRGSLRPDRGGTRSVDVDVARLSDHVARLDRIDLVKMDVEGAELDIVGELARAGLLDRVDRYVIEYHHRIDGEPSRLSEFLRLFEAHGFDYSISATGAQARRTGGFQDVLLWMFRRAPGPRAGDHC